MNEEIDYAEMLEIPVETVTMHRKEKKHPKTDDLSEQVVDRVNDRMEGTNDPQYAESTPIARKERKKIKNAKRILIGEFAAVCALCAVIFFTNLFLPTSAINTFVRGLFQGNSSQAAADTREYSDFKLSSVVRGGTDVALNVSPAGVLSFEGKCSVYAPCEGKLVSVKGDKDAGYTLELKHSDNFSTVIAGVDAVYFTEGDQVMDNVPLAYTDGEGEVRVTFYSGEQVLTCYTVSDTNKLAWS